MTVHLVNLTNPMMMKGPLRETIPVGPLTVRIRLPRDVRPARVKLLTAGTTVPVRVVEGRLRVTVPSVEVHEVIAIDDQGSATYHPWRTASQRPARMPAPIAIDQIRSETRYG